MPWLPSLSSTSVSSTKVDKSTGCSLLEALSCAAISVRSMNSCYQATRCSCWCSSMNTKSWAIRASSKWPKSPLQTFNNTWSHWSSASYCWKIQALIRFRQKTCSLLTLITRVHFSATKSLSWLANKSKIRTVTRSKRGLKTSAATRSRLQSLKSWKPAAPSTTTPSSKKAWSF